MPIIAWRFHQALPATPFQAPDPGEGRMKGELHLILQVEIGSREQRKPRGQVSRKLIPQIGFDQVLHG